MQRQGKLSNAQPYLPSGETEQLNMPRLRTLFWSPALFALITLTGLGNVGAQDVPNLPGKQEVYVVRSVQAGAAVSIGGTVVPKDEVTLAAQIPGRVLYSLILTIRYAGSGIFIKKTVKPAFHCFVI